MATYIVNTNTKEIHKTAKVEPRCRIEEIKPYHRIDTNNAQPYFAQGYNGCKWCYPEKNTG
ncbi:hypothetical protein [Paenibacillus sp. HW567]|uniref:hypothetical protein n=1 Tax=Paenibacillus sp. HW567 TaxID=1034769 RepID=UPI00037EF94F|nr:hypothetical protein [Paenibacillus sp. HW567]